MLMKQLTGGTVGGGMTKTKLWNNPSPNSAFADNSAGNVPLSDDMNNYDALEFEYKTSTSTIDGFSVIMSVEDFKLTEFSSAVGSRRLGLVGCPEQGAIYTRLAGRISDTLVRISTATKQNAAGSNTAYIIPLNVYGINY